jgi:hypothetical protein
MKSIIKLNAIKVCEKFYCEKQSKKTSIVKKVQNLFELRTLNQIKCQIF